MKSLCVSLEKAKKLKAAGWTKPTAYVWVRWNKSQEYDVSKYAIFVSKDGTSNWDWLPSPTAEEVLRELPENIQCEEFKHYLQVWKWKTGIFNLFFGNQSSTTISTQDKSLSEAAAQMWLWCVKNNYIKTEVK